MIPSVTLHLYHFKLFFIFILIYFNWANELISLQRKSKRTSARRHQREVITPRGLGDYIFLCHNFWPFGEFFFQKNISNIFSKVVNKNKFNAMMFDLMEIFIFLVKKKKKTVV
jgi:hypothetical protein